jgi:hypothetical protein
MMNYLNLFGPVARIVMPTLLVGSIKHTHQSRRIAHSRPDAVDELISIIDDGIVCYRRRRQPVASGDGAASIGSPRAADA